MKATVLLRRDHDTLRSLFGRYRKPGNRGQNGKREVFDEIRREINFHAQMETEIFYPALVNTPSERAHELVSGALRDHQTVERLLDQLADLNPQDKHFDDKVTELIDTVSKHIDIEEQEIFEEARKNLPEYRLEELGLEMEDRRRILTQLAA